MDARAAWNTGAAAYAAFVDSGADYYRILVHGPALLAACLPVHGMDVLDLGCGHGYFSRLLAEAGGRVTGIDLSDELISKAVAVEKRQQQAIKYLHGDALETASKLDPESFDLISACMSLQDMPDAAPVLAAAARLLRPDGRVVFSVPHPCTDTPTRVWDRDESGKKIRLGIDRYFETGPAECNWSMARLTKSWTTPCRRYTLSEWSSLIREAGLVINGLQEPRPDATLLTDHPQLEDCARLPYFLIFQLSRTA